MSGIPQERVELMAFALDSKFKLSPVGMPSIRPTPGLYELINIATKIDLSILIFYSI